MAKNKILFYCLFVLFVFLLSSCQKKRTPISYELPENYVGWVTVKYEKPNAPSLEKVNGKFLIKIQPGGIAETSSSIQEGMAKDEYYWISNGKKFVLQQYNEDNTSMIHGDNYSTPDYRNLVNLDTVEIGKEITLPGGGTVTKLDDKGGVNYKTDRPLLYHFFVSQKPEDVDQLKDFLPPLPPDQEKW